MLPTTLNVLMFLLHCMNTAFEGSQSFPHGAEGGL